MKERGFDYTPWNYAPGAPETAIGGLVPRSDDFIRQYGFGRSTLRYSIDDVPDDIVGYPGGLSEREQVDPNLQAQATVEGFGEALFGRIDDAGSTTDGPEPCIVVGERNADVFGTAADDDSRRAITVYTEYAESVAQLAFASEQWRSHIEEIADCISAEGFDEAGSRLLGAEPDRGSFWALEDFASERYEPLLVDGDPEGDWGVVRQLQEWELGLARAAASCDYFEMETAHRVIGQNFEPLVEAEMEGELVWLAGYLAERRS